MRRRTIIAMFLGLAVQGAWGQATSAPASMPTTASATTKPAAALPSMGDVLDVIEKASSPQAGQAKDWSSPVKLATVFALLAILPSLLVMMTSFARIVIVLGFVRRALTTQNIPPTVAIIGLALFLTLFTMSPTLSRINTDAIEPYRADHLAFDKACNKASDLLKEFMYEHTRPGDVTMFLDMAGIGEPQTLGDIPMHVMIPSFAISEFRTAFVMGCLLFIPFLLVDLVVSGILLSTGMMMLPPVIVSLPLKIILFVLVDGWQLLARTLVGSFY